MEEKDWMMVAVEFSNCFSFSTIFGFLVALGFLNQSGEPSFFQADFS